MVMVRLFAAKPLSPPSFPGATLMVHTSRSERWPVQYDVQRVPLHSDAADHAAQLEQWLLDAGAVPPDAAALVADSMTLRLRNATDVWQQVEPHLDGVFAALSVNRYPDQVVSEQQRSIWTYYAGVRCTVKQPHPDTTTLLVEYLETAADISDIDVGVVALYCTDVRAQYDNLVATIKQVFAAVVVQTETEPWPLWDKSDLWLKLRFWQWVYHETEVTGKSQLQVFMRADVIKETAYKWRDKVLRAFDESELHAYPNDMPDVGTLVDTLKRPSV